MRGAPLHRLAEAPIPTPMQNVVLVDYGSGNLHSAHKALVKAAADHGVPVRISVTDDPDQIRQADRIVLPGVGAFGACRAMLAARPGVVDALTDAVIHRTRPFLGICVGMQLLADRGLEYGEHSGLGWIGGTVRPVEAKGLKIPHMGWNRVTGAGHDLLAAAGDAYFVHSYCFDTDDPTHVAATVTYGEQFTAMVVKDHISGVQFHPEKSQAYGLSFLANFLKWDPS